jgi:hypothetical protein
MKKKISRNFNFIPLKKGQKSRLDIAIILCSTQYKLIRTNQPFIIDVGMIM